jgi:hypothetical protein
MTDKRQQRARFVRLAASALIAVAAAVTLRGTQPSGFSHELLLAQSGLQGHYRETAEALQLLPPGAARHLSQEDWVALLDLAMRQTMPPEVRARTATSEAALLPAPTDPWGTPLRFLNATEIGKSADWALQSFGPNRVDDAGRHDDLVIDSRTVGLRPTEVLQLSETAIARRHDAARTAGGCLAAASLFLAVASSAIPRLFPRTVLLATSVAIGVAWSTMLGVITPALVLGGVERAFWAAIVGACTLCTINTATSALAER